MYKVLCTEADKKIKMSQFDFDRCKQEEPFTSTQDEIYLVIGYDLLPVLSVLLVLLK